MSRPHLITDDLNPVPDPTAGDQDPETGRQKNVTLGGIL